MCQKATNSNVYKYEDNTYDLNGIVDLAIGLYNDKGPMWFVEDYADNEVTIAKPDGSEKKVTLFDIIMYLNKIGAVNYAIP